MAMKQKDAVKQALVNVCGNSDGKFTPTKEQRAQVSSILFAGFRAGEIELSREYTDAELKAYVSGLQSNWLRKDKTLNGGVQYVAQNPGSRAGSTDPAIKAMRLLRDTKTDVKERAEIQTFIDARLAEIKPNTVKTLTEEQKAMLIEAGLEHLVD